MATCGVNKVHHTWSMIVFLFKSLFYISYRGLAGERSVPFREWFGNLGELRSLIPQKAKLVEVTATATKSTRQKIFETLHLAPQTVVIKKNPDRSNRKYSAIYIQKSHPFEQIFAEAIKGIKAHGKMAERTMIYCQTRKKCAVIFLPAVCTLLNNGILSNHCEEDIQQYRKTDQCRREVLFAPFNNKPKQVTPM